MHHSTDRIAHTTAFVTPVVEHWLEREIAWCVHPMDDRSDDPSYHEQTLLPRSYISLYMYGIYSHITYRDTYTTHAVQVFSQNLDLSTPWRIDPTTHRTMSKRSYHGATSRSTWGYGIYSRITYSDIYTTHAVRVFSQNLDVSTLWRIDPTTHPTMSKRSYLGATSRSTWGMGYIRVLHIAIYIRHMQYEFSHKIREDPSEIWQVIFHRVVITSGCLHITRHFGFACNSFWQIWWTDTVL